MKKLLIIFVLLDFIFVGLVLHYSQRPSRTVSSTRSTEFEDLTEGQKNKWQLVETFRFDATDSQLQFSTDKLQMICETSTLIELRYFAQNVAYAGTHPAVKHTFSCDAIKKDQSIVTLVTPLDLFRQIHKLKRADLETSQMMATQLFSDEELPQQWRLAEVYIAGENVFTINEYEIEKVLGRSLDFEITTSAK